MTTIQISACVHQEDERILRAWLEGLAGLKTSYPTTWCPTCGSERIEWLPIVHFLCIDCSDSWQKGEVEVTHRFILHNPLGYEAKLIEEILPGARVKAIQTSAPAAVPGKRTHHWNVDTVNIVSAAKNELIREAIASNADYLFFVDSDQVLHPHTLIHLLQQDKDIIGPISWTRWTPEQPELPNVWSYGHYVIEKGALEKWRKPGIYPVGFIGGCLLIKANVLKRGVRYTPIPNLLFNMEDRWFGVRAAVAGFQIWVSTYYPYLHLYREEDLERLDFCKGKWDNDGIETGGFKNATDNG